MSQIGHGTLNNYLLISQLSQTDQENNAKT